MSFREFFCNKDYVRVGGRLEDFPGLHNAFHHSDHECNGIASNNSLDPNQIDEEEYSNMIDCY